MQHFSRGVRLAAVVTLTVAVLTACTPPAERTAGAEGPTKTPTPTATPTPTPTPTPPPPVPTETPTPEPPPPPTPPNAMGGETDGGNTANTPLVEDTGPQEFAVGPASQLNDYEFTYTVMQNDQVLAIASRFKLQTVDVVRVNFPCSDPLNVQPGDVLDIRWPVESEYIGKGC